MIRKICAVVFVVLIVLPCTQPWSTCSVADLGGGSRTRVTPLGAAASAPDSTTATEGDALLPLLETKAEKLRIGADVTTPVVKPKWAAVRADVPTASGPALLSGNPRNLRI